MTLGRVRRVIVLLLFVSAAFALADEPARAGNSCGCPPYTTMYSCFNGADYQYWICYNNCQGYPEPYRTECMDECDQEWFDCQSACINCPV